MKSDFTRDTFDASKHFSRVLMQQGRVQLDADFNEQAAIQLHRLQSLATDLIGPHGGPADEAGDNVGIGIVDVDALSDDEKKRLEAAKVLPLKPGDFLISKGRYYVNGILCENEDYMPYLQQPNWPGQTELAKGSAYLGYLDVWERHLTYVEVEDTDGSVISIRESALDGPDTATRAQVVWQVKVMGVEAGTTCDKIKEDLWPKWLAKWQPANGGLLKARAVQPTSSPDDPCITPPESRYRGAENQLYRVEIHNGSQAKDGTPIQPSFKWSRENGSVIFPISKVSGNTVTVEHLGRDTRFGLQVDDWVEIVDDDYTLQNRAEPLLQVDAIDLDTNIVTLKDKPASTVGQDPKKHPLLRRWDQRKAENSEPSKEGVPIIGSSDWIELEDGIQIQFQPGATYRTGDYWLIPARTATGDVEWPGPVGNPDALPPHGVEHHYAPLWLISVGSDGKVTMDTDNDCRRKITRDNAQGVTPAQIGALAVSDYDLRRTFIGSVSFDQTNINGAPMTIPVGFQPVLVLASGACSAILGGKYYGGTVSSFANLRGGVDPGSCSGVYVEVISNLEWALNGIFGSGLFVGSLFDEARRKAEQLAVRITGLSPTGFTVTLERTVPNQSYDPLDKFFIILYLYCLG